MAITGSYQYLLSYKNFTKFMLGDNVQLRMSNLIYANKEGIFSSVGYLGIYLISYSVSIRFNNIINERFARRFTIQLGP